MSAGAAMPSEEAAAKKGLPGWAKLVIVAGVLGVVIFAMKTFHLGDRLNDAVEWIRGLGAIGVVVYAGLYVVATLVGLATPLTLAAGAIYGPLGGVAIVSPSSVTAATICFLLGRFALRKQIEAKVSKNAKFSAIEKAIGTNGFKIVTLVRLSPVFPFTLLNYGLGLTNVKVRDYVLGSFLGMLPGTAMYVYFGFIGGAATTGGSSSFGDKLSNVKACLSGGVCDSPSALKFALTVVGGIATVIVTIVVTRIARKALADVVPEQKPAA
jgi:uncharacterized membrane protein YdjX (TVP38/TMEM64 family)